METTVEVEEFPAPVDQVAEEAEAQVAIVAKRATRPRLPVIFHRLLPRSRLKAVGQYIASFEYSLHPQTNFNSQKQRPLFLIMETARTIIKSPQPIKCVEAVFLALLLTAGLPDVERFPLSFQTVLGDQDESMSSVVENYKTAYEEQHHAVEKIRVGLPVEHNTRSTNFVCWRHLELDLEDHSWSECCDAIDEFAGKAKRLWNLWIRSGRGEDPWQLYVRQTKRLLADRKPSPLKAKRLNSGRSSDHTAETFENSDHFEPLENQDSRNVNCRFNIQPPSSRESARITLSLEPGEVPYPPKPTKNAKKATGQKENRFNKTRMAVRSQSSHGFSKCRRSKKFFNVGSAQSEDTTIRSAKSIKGGGQNHSVLQPLVESQYLLGTPDGTPGFDGPKTCWECLRTVYQTQNEARLLLLKDKLADLRMQGPQGGETFRVVQGIFQQLVGSGEAITSKLNAFEETITTLTNNFDAVVHSINTQNELSSLKHLATQLTEELPINCDLLHPVKKKKALTHDKTLPVKRNTSPSLRNMEVHEQEIVRRVGEYKRQIGLTSPHSSREESKQLEAERVKSLDLPSGKLVLWHRNRLRDSKLQEQSAPESNSQNDSTDLVAGEDMGPLLEVDVGQFTSPLEQGTGTKKKMGLVQSRLRTKFMCLLGMNNKPSLQLKNHGSRRKTLQKKICCKELQF